MHDLGKIMDDGGADMAPTWAEHPAPPPHPPKRARKKAPPKPHRPYVQNGLVVDMQVLGAAFQDSRRRSSHSTSDGP